MLGIIVILFISIVIIILEAPSLWRKKLKKELIVLILILFSGVGLSIAVSLNPQMASPLDLITAIYKPLSDAILQLLK